MLLIDGHNLIPKIPGFSLRNIDDEQQLIEALKLYCATRQQDVEVFFDQAPVGYSGQRKYGRLTVHFVRKGMTADQAITHRLTQIGKTARNWTVVSSDRQVQVEARSRGATVLPSESFAAELLSVYRPAGDSAPPQPKKKRKGKLTETDGTLSQDDLDEWLRLFGEDKDS